VTLIAGLSLLGSCASPPGGFDSPVPAERLKAATVAAQTQDPQSIPNLIRMLESDDPLVRMTAIRTLERITGLTLGYHYAAAEPEREDAVQHWVRWYREQEGGRPGANPGEAEFGTRAP
jgi:hypothetical protein